MLPEQIYSVSDAAAVINQTLEYAFPFITVVGEVAEYKISGGKWVFFNLKDDEMGLKCFAAVWNIRTPIEDGMRVQVIAKPRIGKYGFSLNIEAIRPIGEGSIKKSFEILRQKLDAEGLFAPERKRFLPEIPTRIGVISSTAAAGYKDFIKILGERFGGIEITVVNTTVQGDGSADQIIRAIRHFNESENPPEIIAILRGGGARDDLATFDDELLVREIAASRVPIITGIGHEIDVTLADLAADVRASTPSNAAEIIAPNRKALIMNLESELRQAIQYYDANLQSRDDGITREIVQISDAIDTLLDAIEYRTEHLSALLSQLNPKTILKNGYAIVRDARGRVLRGRPQIGDEINVEMMQAKFTGVVNKIQKT